jgi:hypothetical protein
MKRKQLFKCMRCHFQRRSASESCAYSKIKILQLIKQQQLLLMVTQKRERLQLPFIV